MVQVCVLRKHNVATQERTMTDKANRVYHSWLQSLSQAGWNADKVDSIKFNHGSETAKHQHAKVATAHILRNAGYRIDTEVTHPERGEIDVIAIPTKESQEPFAVELETSPTPETTQDKLERYYDGTPFVECYVVNLSKVGTDVIEMRKDIQMQL
jgi:hypothetical protein